jgi:hypothetical protein
MAKRARAKIKAQEQKRKSRNRRKSIVVITLILSLGLTSLLLAQWRVIRTSFSPLAPVPTPTPSLAASNPSKEYIYAGGKLVATEEPTSSGGGTSPLSVPSALDAKGDATPQVTLSWTASTGGTVSRYEVERCSNYSLGQSCYTHVADVTPGANSTITYTDSSGVTSGTAYLYRVRAIDSSNNHTNYSNIDLATAVTFADDPLKGSSDNPPPATATTISATHFIQLRTAINAVRHLVDPNAADFNWTTTNNIAPQSGGGIFKSHLNDLRSNLSDALFALGFARPQYEPPDPMTSGQPIKAIHVQQLRNLLK